MLSPILPQKAALGLARERCVIFCEKNRKKENMKKIILLFCVFPFLMATQCEEDTEQTIFRNNFKVKITNQSNLSCIL